MIDHQRVRDLRFEAFVVGLTAIEGLSVLVDPRPQEAGVIGVTVASSLVLLGRRWRPLASCLLAFGLLTVELSLSPRSTTAQFAGTLVTFAVAGAINTERDAVVAWCAGAGLLGYAAWGDPLGGGLPDFLLSLAFGTSLWGAGLLVTRRGRHAAGAAERARIAEADREHRTREAVREERARIARELHDIVSHGLSVAVVQTVVARQSLPDRPGPEVDALDRRLEAVEASSREALAEMRRMLGLLTLDPMDDAIDHVPRVDPAPAPGLAELPALVEHVRAAEISVIVDATPPADLVLPAGLDLAAYRVVQEALTNVVKHAPGATVHLGFDADADGLSVRVVDDGGRGRPGPVDVGGHGLVGMRERVALYGGTLTAGPVPGGGFAVDARLPLTTAADAHRRPVHT